MLRFNPLQHTALQLVALDRLEQRLEIAFAKTIVTLAFNEFKKYRVNLWARKNLQQQARARVAGTAVKQNAARLQRRHVLTMAGQAGAQHLVKGVAGRRHQRHTGQRQLSTTVGKSSHIRAIC